MSQQVQELINKIKSEGVEAAEQKAKEIETQARKNAEKIIADAKRDAELHLTHAKEEVKKVHETTHIALKQASRDMLISLRKEINNTLNKIISHQIHEALSADQLAVIIGNLIKHVAEGKKETGDIHVTLSSHDLEKVKQGVLAKLQHQVKSEIKFQSSDSVGKGFLISYDAGKSNFDFTDISLSEYLSRFLNEQIGNLVKEAAVFK